MKTQCTYYTTHYFIGLLLRMHERIFIHKISTTFDTVGHFKPLKCKRFSEIMCFCM